MLPVGDDITLVAPDVAPDTSAGIGTSMAIAEVADALGSAVSSHGRILIVDDEPAILEMVAEYLSIQGFVVVTANSGLEALARLETEQPDAVLLDVRMPEIDGIETLRRIMARDQSVRVLMVSANDDLLLAKEAITLGAVDYLLKPIDFDYLSRILQQMTQGSVASDASGLMAAPVEPPSGPLAYYDLALAICRVTRALPAAAKRTVGRPLERLAIWLVRQGPGGERRKVLRQLNHMRSLARFAKDLGDISDDTHRQLESLLVRARRSVGGS
jgi:CheY-like chemotaxis protein